jgi:3-phosphoshikimate 1-carboxyvinyltransferase
MALPELIEILPPVKPVSACVTIPGSKSITNRALVLAAISRAPVTLMGALWSEDTQVMVECLKKLGFEVIVKQDPGEDSNRIISVRGAGGRIPNSGTREQPLDLFVGNAGTAARFLAALVCLGHGYFRLHGVPRMHERPQEDLFHSLRELGYEILTPNDRLPAIIRGKGPKAAASSVSIKSSSQFASALLLCSKVGKWEIRVTGENAEESPYVAMTVKLMEAFPGMGGMFMIEPDSSSGSYFKAAGWMLLQHHGKTGADGTNTARNLVEVQHWPTSSWQIDSAFPSFLPLPAKISRLTDLGDSIMTAMIIAADAVSSSQSAKPVTDIELLQVLEKASDFRSINFTDLGRLRVQECERVEAMRTELAKCGAAIMETGQTLMIVPSDLRGAEIETYNDHRMAMCFATLGLCIPGIRIRNPACVKKTFPNFFQKLAAPAPVGLGIEILDAKTGQRLGDSELFAD